MVSYFFAYANKLKAQTQPQPSGCIKVELRNNWVTPRPVAFLPSQVLRPRYENGLSPYGSQALPARKMYTKAILQ